jgi:hypothetical protein
MRNDDRAIFLLKSFQDGAHRPSQGNS